MCLLCWCKYGQLIGYSDDLPESAWCIDAMRITRLKLKNWKNFVDVDVNLAERVFILGNNSLGKSNLLDALRFLYDIAKPNGGGLQLALETRGGMRRVRSLFARKNPLVRIYIEVDDPKEDTIHDGTSEGKPKWRYELELWESGDKERTLVKAEKVFKHGKVIVKRPFEEEKGDDEALAQTALEQANLNRPFRELVQFIRGIQYLHMVPQLVRYTPEFQGKVLPRRPFWTESDEANCEYQAEITKG